MLRDVDFPWPIVQMVVQHHERLDGSGYPAGLAGDAISLEARIIAVADVFESMSTHRPYRVALGADAAALAELNRGRGALFDASVIDACRATFEECGGNVGVLWSALESIPPVRAAAAQDPEARYDVARD